MIQLWDSTDRCVVLGEYLIEHRATVRSCATYFQISKSTVHKDVTQQLKKINPELYSEVNCLLEQNKKERHLRGGEATRQKYIKIRGNE